MRALADRMPSRGPALLVAALVAAVAVAARLLTLLAGGGLLGLGNYDDGVHYASAVGLLHGRLPYQDFLFLHPPGITLLLTPVALLGELSSDASGVVAARLGWILLGAANALLTAAALAPIGRGAAVLGGLAYAVWQPAIYSERTVLLEAPATTCLLAAIILTEALHRNPAPSRRRLVVAGFLLGFAVTIKIWGVLPVLVLFGWLARRLGARATAFLLGAVAAAIVVCLPFFAVAPATMWRMVVVDQVGRRPLGVPVTERLVEMLGLTGHQLPLDRWSLALALMVGLVAAATVRVAVDRQARLLAVLLVVLIVLLLSTPSWFLHYSSVLAAPLVLVLAAAAQLVARTAARRFGLWSAAVVLGLVLAALAAYASPLPASRFGRPFPGAELGAAVRDLPGCVTTDDPMALLQMDVFTRNLERGCTLVIDLGGASYDLQRSPGEEVSRRRNRVWQAYALTYFRTGTAAISTRFRPGNGFSRATARTMASWPVLAEVDGYQVRQPRP